MVSALWWGTCKVSLPLLSRRVFIHARNSTFTPIPSSPYTTNDHDQSSISNSDIGASTTSNPAYEMHAPTRTEHLQRTSWASKAKTEKWMNRIIPDDVTTYNWDLENFTAASIQVSNSPRLKVSNGVVQPMRPDPNIRDDTTQSSFEEIPMNPEINSKDDNIQSSLDEFPSRKLKIRNEKMEAVHALEEEFSTEDEEDLHHTLRKLSRALTPPKSDVDPEERIAAERSLFEPQENKSERSSVRAQTPPPTDKLSLPTPKVTGAFIETPAPIHALRPSTPEYSSSTEEDFDQTPIQNKLIQGNKPSRRSLSPEKRQSPINTAPNLSVSEDLKTIKKEALIEDSTIEREFEAVLEADAIIINDITTHSPRKHELESETLERMDRSLRHTSTSIRAARQGIERLEERVSRSVTIRSTTSWIRDFSWLGTIIALFIFWLMLETVVCEAYCHTTTSNHVTPWYPDDPFFGVALPVKLNDWTGGFLRPVFRYFGVGNPGYGGRVVRPLGGEDWWRFGI